ncbi:hypothetical protein BH20ACI1_BH20ACI1_23100 [soil metagenome]
MPLFNKLLEPSAFQLLNYNLNKISQKTVNKNYPAKFYYVWNYLEWGGAQILLFGLMKEGKNIGEVLAVIPENSNEQLLRFLKNLNVECKFVDSYTDTKPAVKIKRKLERHWKKLWCEFVYFRYLKNLDLENSIIHAEFAPWHSFLILFLLAKKTPVFITVHNALPPVPRWRYFSWQVKFWLLSRRKNFHIFTANKDTKESLKTLVPQKAFDKIKIIYANVNPHEIDEALNSEIDRTELLKKYKIPENKFLVFCVGQFIDRKGRWIFLEAARKLLEKNNDIAFVWISNSKPDADDLAKADSYNLGENFRLITSDQIGTAHIDLFKLLRPADLFALPSYLEGLPISIIEAMALGIPTISTNINAIPEAIRHLETGWLIEPGNSDLLVEAVQTLKDDEDLRNKLSQKGRKFALENFNESVVAKIALESYLDAFRSK